MCILSMIILGEMICVLFLQVLAKSHAGYVIWFSMVSYKQSEQQAIKSSMSNHVTQLPFPSLFFWAKAPIKLSKSSTLIATGQGPEAPN